MAANLFVVLIPRKEHEEEIKKIDNEKSKSKKKSPIVLENIQEKYNILLSKYNSTDQLTENHIPNNLSKCNSVSGTINDQCCVRFPWGELKQAIRPRSNKFKITTPHRGCDIPMTFQPETPLETALLEVLKQLNVKSASWNPTRNNDFFQVIFSVESSTISEEMLLILRNLGFGSRCQSSVSVIPCALYYKNMSDTGSEHVDEDTEHNINGTVWTRFASSVRSRTNLAQVLHDVRTDAALTFDWLFLLTVAAFVSAIGLVENSTIILVASMLISPLMGPITAGTLGTAMRDRSLLTLGIYNEILGLFLSLAIGFMFGLVIGSADERYGLGNWPTSEMISRCEVRSLWIGVLVAIPSGAGVALAVLGEYTASLVGVAISASLLPSAVNAGLLWAMSLLIFMSDENNCCTVIKSEMYSVNPAVELAVLGSVSLCLTLVNIVCIFVAGVLVYKVKEVSPMDRREISWWRTNRRLLEASTLSKQVELVPSTWERVKYSRWLKESMERTNSSDNDTQSAAQVHNNYQRTTHPEYRYQNKPTETCSEFLNEPKLSLNDIKEDDATFDSDCSSSNSLGKMEDLYKRSPFRTVSHAQKANTVQCPTIEVTSSKTIDVGKLYVAEKTYHV